MSSFEDRRRRALDRATTIVLQRSRVGAMEADLHPLRGAPALSLVRRLTEESWSLAGLLQPSYPRSQTPCVFVRDARG